jgi:hypothetical protein
MFIILQLFVNVPIKTTKYNVFLFFFTPLSCHTSASKYVVNPLFFNYFFSDLFLITFSQLQLFSDKTFTFRHFVFWHGRQTPQNHTEPLHLHYQQKVFWQDHLDVHVLLQNQVQI